MSAVYWLEQDATVEERGGMFFLDLKSGDTTFSFALTPRRAGALGCRATRAVETFQSQQGVIIALHGRKAGPKAARKSRSKAEA